MCTFRLLIVEDNKSDLDTCRDSVKKYMDQKKCNISLVECKTVEDAFQKLNNSFDGVIIDLKLAKNGDEGNQVIKRIEESNFRIPIAIFTGTPERANNDFSYIGVFTKGETEYTSILDVFWGIYNTGLTRIMGGRGIIEQTLSTVFLNNILPQKDTWISYGATDSLRTEKALLRYTLNHLLQLLDNDDEKYFPEEVYIYPPLVKTLKTGSVVRMKSDNKAFVVLTPACDLVLREKGSFKTDRILLAEIDNDGIIGEIKGILSSKNKKEKEKVEKCKHHHPESESYKRVLSKQNESIVNGTTSLLKNTHDLYHHWIPQRKYFEGGFINFRKLSAFSKESFDEKYHLPQIQISPSFVKDIIARFSSYYARQGQPDIYFQKIIDEILK